MDNIPVASDTDQEIKFWLELEGALNQINDQLNGPKVQCTLNTLKRAKRYHATVAFDSGGDTIGMKNALEKVNDYKILMKDFPIDALLTSTDIGTQIPNAINEIFSHLIKRAKNTSYPTKRFAKLLECLGKDLRQKLLSLLQSKRLMDIEYNEFAKLIQECHAVFRGWVGSHAGPPFGFESFRDFIWNKRRQPLSVKVELKLLEDRINEIALFRREHEELRSVIISSLASSGGREEIKAAYNTVSGIDVLDLSEEGNNKWEIARKKYSEHVDRVESQIASRLRDKLATAKNANEMFRIFGQFSALLRRPRIVGATREYQNQLLQRVKEDIEILHEKFIKSYNHSEEKYLSLVRDIPETSGTIIWAQQISRQLELYMKRIEQVLGEDWSRDVEGQKLLKYAQPLKEKLNTEPFFKKWCSEMEERNFEISGRLLKIIKANNKFQVDVNFDPKIITLFKEVRNLQWLGKTIPITITIHSSSAERVYPFAVSLRETLRSYTQTCNKLNPTTAMLVASYKLQVQNKVTEGFKLKWDYLGKEDTFVKNFSEIVNIFSEKVDNLIEKEQLIERELTLVENCLLDQKSFTEILDKIQKIIDELNLLSYSNLDSWVKELDKRIEDMLLSRLVESQEAWLQIFTPQKTETFNENETENKKLVTAPKLERLTHYIAIRNQVVTCYPPLEHARSQWVSQLNQWLGMICDLKRLRGSRYDEGLFATEDNVELTYRSILLRLPPGTLQQTYEMIEKKIDEVSKYVDVWLQYQALWDMDSSVVYDKLGDNLSVWQQLLGEIQQSRKTFDVSQSTKDFGPITIDFKQVQGSISNKYDYWHKDILFHFGNKLGVAMQEGYGEISNARLDLERNSLDLSSVENTVSFILRVQTLKKRVPAWEKSLELFRTGQELLRRQRFQFPSSWLEFLTIEGEWSAFTQILKRKDDSIKEQLPSLQSRIVEEGKEFEKRLNEFYSDWSKGKPLAGATSFTAALESLQIFSGRLSRLQEDKQRIVSAKTALDLEPQADDRLNSIQEELSDLQGVWNELAGVWNEVESLKTILWSAVIPRKIRKDLEEIQAKMKALPNRMRQYAAYIHVDETIKGYLRVNIIINDLRSEALRDRHWQELKRKLGVSWVLSELTLGEVWNSDVKKHEVIYKEIITRAQGELALEEFLKQIREYWSSFEVELVNYQNKSYLIKGWDDLFAKLNEHLNSISAMKASPYYKVFEEQANTWDDKLNRTRNLLDVWIDVQRRWVYLEGIFSGSGDIAALLPVESSRFKSINTEFTGIMKKVNVTRLLIEVLNYEGIQKTLDRIADTLTKIQKALGDYLERQRSAFPRFYFVGDEDLLEIIGNSKDIERLQKHLKKMFAGLSMLVLDESKTQVLGMASREGETVMFKRVVSLKDNPKINEWLTKVENEMKFTLASLFQEALAERLAADVDGKVDKELFLKWVGKYPAQLVVICAQTVWTQASEAAICKLQSQPDALENYLNEVINILDILAGGVLDDITIDLRKKFETLITELVHQRDVLRKLIRSNVNSIKSFEWLYEMRFYFTENKESVLKNLTIRMANASFYYGYEYLGIAEKLVQTPLTDRCYLALTQALEGRMGGSPFGPAGTGKTETVKALGGQLGRYVVVFCCDEGFDFQAMSRIFVGLCQCGAWGCFDEFNRLEERILSAVSQQIQTMQVALKENTNEVEIIGRPVRINPDMGIFITMNPGYAGRSNLPDNLKQLFRGIAMISPDRELIAQVMLYSQGFKTAERLAGKIVPLFKLCLEQLSDQSHYDFGLRALKSVLVSAGNLKRKQLQGDKELLSLTGEKEVSYEQDVMLRSICENIIPKLVAEDIGLFKSLLSDVFPGAEASTIELGQLKAEIIKLTNECNLVPGLDWVEKQLQLYATQSVRHGVMIVGPSGSGKTVAWKILLEAMERCDGIETVPYVLDPKAISKDELFGTLDATTREWTDGLFTHILRKIVDNVRGESSKRHWIILDGDVDPEWVENLNSLLDDNKLLTLPNGERLSLPDNIRIIFEVENLKYATPATVSRCGMIWFSEETMSTQMIFTNYLTQLKNIPITEQSHDIFATRGKDFPLTPTLQLQREIVDIIQPYFSEEGFINQVYKEGSHIGEHIMDYTRLRVLGSMLSLLNKGVRNIHEYNEAHPDFPLPSERVEKYMTNRVVYSCMWGFGGSLGLNDREQFSKYIHRLATTSGLPDISGPPLLDFFVDIDSGNWVPWSTTVPTVEIESDKAASPDIVIPTVDTVRHVEVLHSWLAEHKPLLLCGPPGSGKTMTLYSTLSAFPDFEFISLNFSSATTPDLILKTFEHHCEFKKTQRGTILHPKEVGKWLVVFCDEINLPTNDKYGTQKVITFLRQLIEQGGYWRTTDHTWIILEKIQFVGACNPPTDPGRVPLTHRFLRYSPLLLVDFPSVPSLHQIYGTFARALLKLLPALRPHSQALTEAMVEVYSKSQRKFTPDLQSHYIYSPRELSRWIRALHEALKASNDLDLNGLVRIWAHEGLRLFQDRLVEDEEKKWTDDLIDEVAKKHFVGLAPEIALARPILFSNWLTKEYVSVEREILREYVQARLKVFAEEELDVNIVVFNEVLEHILRIDRVFRQPQGHALLIGVSGGGKTVLSRFVAWLNGLTIFTIKVNNKYSAEDFDEDLRHVMRQSGAQNEKICFIFDESNVLESSFLERMNTLLAGGEVPGLFEGDEFTSLMNAVKEDATNRAGLILDTTDELYKYFTKQVRLNLHIVFTMNPASPDFHNRAATSPALYNRCVLDWFGEWSEQALFQVGSEFTKNVDLDDINYLPPAYFPEVSFQLPQPVTHRAAVITSLVFVHNTIAEANVRLAKTQGRQNYVTPRHFLDLINQFVNLLHEKREELEEQQLHLNIGLQKLRETQEQVGSLQISLREKNKQLEEKNKLANEKLKQMVDDQQIAEQKKKVSIELQGKLKIQNEEIGIKKARAYEDLAKVEPTVEEAKKAVQGIKKSQLDEVRALANPPQKVRMAMEAVMLLLGYGKLDWAGVRKTIMDAKFIPNIVKFDSESITPEIRSTIDKNYIANPDFTYEIVNHASKACGPLVKWVRAQCTYSGILNSVAPLRDEVDSLEKLAKELQNQQTEMEITVKELERSIGRYKDEYAVLISETQAIKTEMETVQNKVERSISLLNNLSSEQERWELTSASFQDQMATLVGDCLLSSAFLAYSGFFDQKYRDALMSKWQGRLIDVSIKFKQELSVIEYLSHPDERLTWQSNSLPADNLCVENAIMMNRFNRYPLLIDPSGQAAEFLMKQYKAKKIVQTSFLDSSFMKNLETSLRFGTPLLVHDVESIDPVLNPVLNKEIRKTGGRVLIRLGDQDVDFSPSFIIFLATRDPTAHFTPDLCSRVTFVNFTVTPSSLLSQCLHEVLKAERPDIEQKRSDLLKMQGEFKVRLRNLEKSLLNALNESSGSILDDDKVINTLTTLKKEALDITQKVEETEVIFEEITRVSAIYVQIASFCSKIYFAMEQLASVHFLYQFSLRFFLDMFHDLLHNNANLKGIEDPLKRLDLLIKDIFIIIYQRVTRTLLHEDQLTFALRLGQIRLQQQQASVNDIPADELDFFMKGGENIATTGQIHEFSKLQDLLSEQQQRYVFELQQTLPLYKSLRSHMESNKDEWLRFFKSQTAELEIPSSWEDHLKQQSGKSSLVIQYFRRLLLLKSLRPDRLMAGVTQVIQQIFGEDYLQVPELNLSYIAEHESNSSSPLLFCSMPGHDAVGLVDDLAAKMKKKLSSIAIGSPEGFDLAEKSIHAATKSGTWVLLKNIHLAPQWLTKLEKKLHSLNPNPNFRLFMTSEIHPKLPGSLLRQSHIFSFEPPPGVKANLLHTLSSVDQARMEKKPIERTRLYFMMAWFHAIVQERVRYAPLGWSKLFEFGDTDKRCALETLDYWVDSVGQGRDNVNPDNIPWEAIRTLLGQSVYGGRIDNEFDQRLLDSFLHQLLSPKAYDYQFKLVEYVNESQEVVTLLSPEGTTKRDFLNWVQKLPDNESPAWLGLPNNAEILLLTNQAKRMIVKFLKMQSIELDESDSSPADDKPTQGSSDNQRPAWANALLKFIATWKELLPKELKELERTAKSLSNPLFRFFEREVTTGRNLLRKIHNDFATLTAVANGEQKQTNYIRSLMNSINKALIPSSWRIYSVSDATSLSAWLVDFIKRIQQLQSIQQSADYGSKVWVGGLFNPEAFLTATRQAAARAHSWSLENLVLIAKVLPADKPTVNSDSSSFIATGLMLEAAEWSSEKEELEITTEMSTKLPPVEFTWVLAENRPVVNEHASIVLPIYLNEMRLELLTSIPINGPLSVPPTLWYQRGVAILTVRPM